MSQLTELQRMMDLLRATQKSSECLRAIQFDSETEEAGGHWVTMGGHPGSDGKRHGGSPVFIGSKSGLIEKGPKGLTGQKPGQIKRHPLYDRATGSLVGNPKPTAGAGHHESPLHQAEVLEGLAKDWEGKAEVHHLVSHPFVLPRHEYESQAARWRRQAAELRGRAGQQGPEPSGGTEESPPEANATPPAEDKGPMSEEEIAQAVNRGDIPIEDILDTHPHLAGDALVEQHRRERRAMADAARASREMGEAHMPGTLGGGDLESLAQEQAGAAQPPSAAQDVEPEAAKPGAEPPATGPRPANVPVAAPEPPARGSASPDQRTAATPAQAGAASKPIDRDKLHNRVQELKAQGLPTDRAVARARMEMEGSTPPKPTPQPQAKPKAAPRQLDPEMQRAADEEAALAARLHGEQPKENANGPAAQPDTSPPANPPPARPEPAAPAQPSEPPGEQQSAGPAPVNWNDRGHNAASPEGAEPNHAVKRPARHATEPETPGEPGPQETEAGEAASEDRSLSPEDEAKWSDLHWKHHEHEYVHVARAKAAHDMAQKQLGDLYSKRKAYQAEAARAARSGDNERAGRYEESASKLDEPIREAEAAAGRAGAALSESQNARDEIARQKERILPGSVRNNVSLHPVLMSPMSREQLGWHARKVQGEYDQRQKAKVAEQKKVAAELARANAGREKAQRQADDKAHPDTRSRSAIERTLMDHFHQTSGESESGVEDDKALAPYHAPFTFLRTQKTKSGYPGEVERFMEGPGKRMRRMFALTDDPAKAQGDDAMRDMGEQRYFDLVGRRGDMGGRVGKAIEAAKNSPDPEMKLLAAIYETMPRKANRAAVESVPAHDLQPGEEMTINGIPAEVTENEDGEKILKDHGDLPEVPVDALDGLKLPVDKGSRREKPVEEIGDDPFGDIADEPGEEELKPNAEGGDSARKPAEPNDSPKEPESQPAPEAEARQPEAATSSGGLPTAVRERLAAEYQKLSGPDKLRMIDELGFIPTAEATKPAAQPAAGTSQAQTPQPQRADPIRTSKQLGMFGPQAGKEIGNLTGSQGSMFAPPPPEQPKAAEPEFPNYKPEDTREMFPAKGEGKPAAASSATPEEDALSRAPQAPAMTEREAALGRSMAEAAKQKERHAEAARGMSDAELKNAIDEYDRTGGGANPTMDLKSKHNAIREEILRRKVQASQSRQKKPAAPAEAAPEPSGWDNPAADGDWTDINPLARRAPWPTKEQTRNAEAAVDRQAARANDRTVGPRKPNPVQALRESARRIEANRRRPPSAPAHADIAANHRQAEQVVHGQAPADVGRHLREQMAVIQDEAKAAGRHMPFNQALRIAKRKLGLPLDYAADLSLLNAGVRETNRLLAMAVAYC